MSGEAKLSSHILARLYFVDIESQGEIYIQQVLPRSAITAALMEYTFILPYVRNRLKRNMGGLQKTFFFWYDTNDRDQYNRTAGYDNEKLFLRP